MGAVSETAPSVTALNITCVTDGCFDFIFPQRGCFIEAVTLKLVHEDTKIITKNTLLSVNCPRLTFNKSIHEDWLWLIITKDLPSNLKPQEVDFLY